jgi:hypothetical protein
VTWSLRFTILHKAEQEGEKSSCEPKINILGIPSCFQKDMLASVNTSCPISLQNCQESAYCLPKNTLCCLCLSISLSCLFIHCASLAFSSVFAVNNLTKIHIDETKNLGAQVCINLSLNFCKQLISYSIVDGTNTTIRINIILWSSSFTLYASFSTKISISFSS